MFINLSNHSSHNFTSEQLDAASKYGDIVDYPFPNIDPSASSLDVFNLAKDTLHDILNQYGSDCVIHVMGELNFTFSFVKQASDMGIHCIASTTERIVTANLDGSKTSQFHFVRFREYF